MKLTENLRTIIDIATANFDSEEWNKKDEIIEQRQKEMMILFDVVDKQIDDFDYEQEETEDIEMLMLDIEMLIFKAKSAFKTFCTRHGVEYEP